MSNIEDNNTAVQYDDEIANSKKVNGNWNWNEPWHDKTNKKGHSGKSATIRESNHGSGVCKEHYA